jgi:hypothetical protein
MHEDNSHLKDVIFDAIAEGRHTLQVPNVTFDTGKATFEVTFKVTIDNETRCLMTALAQRQARTLRAVMRRYCRLAFKACLAPEADEAEAEAA